MKIFSYLLVSSFFILGTSAFAQSTSENSISKQRKTTTEKVDHRVAELTEKLDLTIDQQSKMKAISTTLLEGIKKTKSDSNKTDEEKQNDIERLKKAYQDKLNGILTTEQQEKLSDLRKKKTAEERAADKTAKMTKQLSLTPEQVEQVSYLNLKVANKIESIRKDKSLSKEKKQEFIAGNMNDHMSVMATILTAEQLKTYENWLNKKEVKRTAK